MSLLFVRVSIALLVSLIRLTLGEALEVFGFEGLADVWLSVDPSRFMPGGSKPASSVLRLRGFGTLGRHSLSVRVHLAAAQ